MFVSVSIGDPISFFLVLLSLTNQSSISGEDLSIHNSSEMTFPYTPRAQAKHSGVQIKMLTINTAPCIITMY